MDVIPTSHPMNRTLSTTLILAATGLVGGCDMGSSHASHPTGHAAPIMVQQTPPPPPAANSASESATGLPMDKMSGMTSVPRRKPAFGPGQKVDPFWIRTFAESDRAIWENTAKTAAPMNRSGSSVLLRSLDNDDAAEGLSHVTLAPEGADFDPCVSRDGRFIAFASTQHRPTSDIYIKPVNGSTITQLTSDPANDVMPAFSPDGSRIAFCSSRNGNWDIFVMSSGGGQALQLTSDPSQELHPTWSPDGKRIAFCRLGESSGRWEMWVMDVGGTGTSEFIGYGMFPQWCPVAGTGADGRDKILFQRSRERGDRAFSVWTIDYRAGDASSPTEVVFALKHALINACWSPDGARIVYAAVPNSDEGVLDSSSRSSLWMAAVDGSQRVMLTSGPFMNLMPSWSGDGRIYFVSDRGGLPNIWAVGTERAITTASGHASPRVPATETATVPDEHGTPTAPR
jgi:TolB protein